MTFITSALLTILQTIYPSDFERAGQIVDDVRHPHRSILDPFLT